MKKRELILDFTSLLDVIMILLFIVVSNMAKASASVNEDSKQALAEAGARIEELSGERDELLEQLEHEADNEEQLLEVTSRLQTLQMEYTELQTEYEYLKSLSEISEDDPAVYELALERMTRMVVLCETGVNTETGNAEVLVHIFQNAEDASEHTLADTVVLEHDLELTREERAKCKAKQIVDVTSAFTEALGESDKDILWFSVQYRYDDVNISKTDLDIIKESVENLERTFGKICVTEEIKMYQEDME